jgi:uncharacterized membrane protein (DUF2068 family)
MNFTLRRGDASLVWIGAYKLAHGLLLAIVATRLLKAVNQDLQAMLIGWVKAFHFDPGNRHVAALLHKAGLIDHRTLKHLSWLTFTYGAIFVVEGVGLMFKKQWAKYLTVIVTISLVPLELFEIAKHFTLLRLAILVVNIAIVVYLLVMIRRKPESSG